MTTQRAAIAITLACFAFVGAGPTEGPVLKPDIAFSAPLYFVANAGQADARALFYAQTPGATVWLTRDGLILDRALKTANGDAEGAVLGMSFIGANRAVDIAAADPTDYRVSYFLGRDESEWKTDIPTSRAVLYRNVYDGIDLKVYGTDRELEYDWIVAPGARPERIRLAVSGPAESRLDGDGNLRMETPAGLIVQRRPVAFQTVEGRRVAVDAAFRRAGDGSYGFAVGAYDPRYALTIDPLVLIYGTYLGGHDEDHAYNIAVDPTGAVYICGITASRDFPPVTQTLPRKDVFVTKLAPDGKSLVYSAFFPGATQTEFENMGLFTDAQGFVYVAASTQSPRFPLKNAFQSKFAGGYSDGFILKLAKSGKSLVYSSYIGGLNEDYVEDLAVDASGAAYIAGYTKSPDFPTKRAFQTTMSGYYEGFLAKIDPQGAGLVYSTYLGSSGSDQCASVAVDADGAATVVGGTSSFTFPLKAPLQNAHGGGGWDAFVTRFSPSGDSLVYSTYLGGVRIDWPYGMTMDASGAVYVAGSVNGAFPLKNAFQKARKGSNDAFVAKISSTGRELVYSSYLGGTGNDIALEIGVDDAGTAFIVGLTESANFPVRFPLLSSRRGREDGFLAVVAPNGGKLLASTYLGGAYRERAYGVVLGPKGTVYLAVETNSPDAPIKGAYQGALAGEYDAFIMKFKFANDPGLGAGGLFSRRPLR